MRDQEHREMGASYIRNVCGDEMQSSSLLTQLNTSVFQTCGYKNNIKGKTKKCTQDKTVRQWLADLPPCKCPFCNRFTVTLKRSKHWPIYKGACCLCNRKLGFTGCFLFSLKLFPLKCFADALLHSYKYFYKTYKLISIRTCLRLFSRADLSPNAGVNK